MPLKFITYGDYVWFPVICALSWFGMVLGLLLWWLLPNNGERYVPSDADIVFLSDVGAAHQWLFILGCTLTAVFYVATLVLERWLRHVDRIPSGFRSREKILDILTIICGAIGGIALIVLSCFKDTVHPTVHWICTVIFVLFVAFSCVFQTWEFFALQEDHPDRNHLRRNSIIKVIVLTAAICVAIAFAALYAVCHGNGGNEATARCDKITSAAAVCEWTVSFLLAIYFATFVLDLWPAAKTSPRYLRRQQEKHASDGEKGLVAPAAAFSRQASDTPVSSVANIERPTEAERSDYYASHPEHYQQDPAPVHNPSGIAYQNPQYAAPASAYPSTQHSAPASAYPDTHYAAPTSAYPEFRELPRADSQAPTYHGSVARY